MKKELTDILASYLYGWKTLQDCAQWLASINWNNLQIESDTLELIGRVELVITEVIEGIRSESEFQVLANGIVSSETDTYIVLQTSTSVSISSSTDSIVSYPLIPMGNGV